MLLKKYWKICYIKYITVDNITGSIIIEIVAITIILDIIFLLFFFFITNPSIDVYNAVIVTVKKSSLLKYNKNRYTSYNRQKSSLLKIYNI